MTKLALRASVRGEITTFQIIPPNDEQRILGVDVMSFALSADIIAQIVSEINATIQSKRYWREFDPDLITVDDIVGCLA